MQNTQPYKLATIEIGNYLINNAPIEVNNNKLESKNMVTMYTGALPLVIKSEYIVKGSRYIDVSLYTLNFESLLGPSTSVHSEISFTNLFFIKRSESVKTGRKEIDEQWNILKEPKLTL